MYRFSPLLMLALSGCFQLQISEAYDRDADGFPAVELGGPDCDDSNPAVYPGADEICGNGIDDNCSGVIDDAGTGAITFYVDEDGDGYPGTTPRSSCFAPEGSFASLVDGGDCDDGNPDISPGIAEIWYDGIDQNCDQNDDDQDGDGVSALSAGGSDCVDTDPNIHPNAPEICNNGIDDDCDGGPGHCAMSGIVHGEDLQTAAFVGVGELAVGDVTGDGWDELLFNRAVLASTVRTPIQGVFEGLNLVHTSVNATVGGSEAPEFGFAMGDITGDGVSDYARGRPFGIVVVNPLDWLDDSLPYEVGEASILGELPAGVLVRMDSWSDGVFVVSDEASGRVVRWFSETSFPVALLSVPPVSVAANATDGVVVEVGTSSALVLSAPPLAEIVALENGEMHVVTPQTGEVVRRIVGLDIDGDGDTDVASLFARINGSDVVRLHKAPFSSVSDVLGESPAFVVESATGQDITSVVACDITRDGVRDVVVSFVSETDVVDGRGLAVFVGPVSGSSTLLEADATIIRTGGRHLACIDADRDGLDDIVVSDAWLGFTEVLTGRGL